MWDKCTMYTEHVSYTIYILLSRSIEDDGGRLIHCNLYDGEPMSSIHSIVLLLLNDMRRGLRN